MLIYVCLSSHGFGHASRQAALLAEIHRLRPDYRIIISSKVNKSFLKTIFRDIPVEFRSFRWDIGMIQQDAFNINIDRTLTELNKLDEILPSQIKKEAEWIISQKDKSLILADIPYSANHLSKLTGSKLIWFGNFGWDDIYQPFDKILYKHRLNAHINYQQGDLLIRCPFSLEMNWNIPEISIGLTSAKPSDLSQSFKSKLLSFSRPIILVGFGGFGYRIDPKLFRYWPDHIFLLTSENKYNNAINKEENILFLPNQFKMLDVMGYCDRILTKPGYCTFCEAIINSVGIHSFTRSNFIESDSLLKGLKSFSSHRILNEEFIDSGNWELDKPLKNPDISSFEINGVEVAAKEINKYINSFY